MLEKKLDELEKTIGRLKIEFDRSRRTKFWQGFFLGASIMSYFIIGALCFERAYNCRGVDEAYIKSKREIESKERLFKQTYLCDDKKESRGY